MAEAFIVAATRTAGGRRNGRLRGWHPADLAGGVLDELLRRTDLDPALVEDVIMGCVGQAGEQSANIGRNAVLSSRLPESTPGTTIDRQCGSSQQAMHFAAQAIMSGSMDVVIAAGVESMTRVPMGLPTSLAAKEGFGHPIGRKMGARYEGAQISQFAGAEMIAEKYGLSRDDLDAYGLLSHQRAAAATRAGEFKEQILPVEGLDAEGEAVLHDVDEGIRFDASLEAMGAVKLLREGGRLTAATSSQIADGASGVMLVSEAALKAYRLTPLARIHHMTVLGGDPVMMLEAPIPATARALQKTGMSIDDIDLYECNEAFASVPLAWMKALGADPDKMNVNGGGIALGHPVGASGTKLMATLTHGLKARDKRWGLQTMCEGGGLANVTIVERL
jgi:acetyl-CoA C-acetyltransferase